MLSAVFLSIKKKKFYSLFVIRYSLFIIHFQMSQPQPRVCNLLSRWRSLIAKERHEVDVRLIYYIRRELKRRGLSSKHVTPDVVREILFQLKNDDSPHVFFKREA